MVCKILNVCQAETRGKDHRDSPNRSDLSQRAIDQYIAQLSLQTTYNALQIDAVFRISSEVDARLHEQDAVEAARIHLIVSRRLKRAS